VTSHPKLTIRELRARAVNVPMPRPLQTSGGMVGTAPLVLIDLLTEEGITGCSYVFCYTPLVLKPVAQLITGLETLVKSDVVAPVAIESKSFNAGFGSWDRKVSRASPWPASTWLPGMHSQKCAQRRSVPETLRRTRVLDNEGIYWVEEPTVADDFAGHAQISRETRTPIQIGENWWGSHDMAKSIAVGASDLVMPDAMKIGGVTGWMRAAALADSAGLPVSSHLFPEVSAHLLVVTPTCHWLGYVDWANPVLQEPLRIEKGSAIICDAPGIGISWNDESIECYWVQ
jgi:L-alanine-DL-glutamate epimerase and related enzymes of enolase superfamily